MPIDHIDRKILSFLQENSSISTARIAKIVGLSTTPCWRRIQNLEKRGIIGARVALLDRKKLNVDIDVFVSISTDQHNAKWMEQFKRVVKDFPEVVEFYRMSGNVDYLLRVVVPDIKAYDSFYCRLIERIDISDVSSSFAMECIKSTTALPLDYI